MYFLSRRPYTTIFCKLYIYEKINKPKTINTMKKPILLTLMALFCATALWAKPVTSEQAQKVAATFIK